MKEQTLGNEELEYIQAFERAIVHWTRDQQGPPVSVKDCIAEPERLTFVVQNGQLGLALGKEARNLNRLKEMFRREIKIVEFDTDPAEFVSNLFKPFKPEKVVVEHKRGGGPLVATVTLVEAQKGKAIGKGGKNVNLVRRLARRHHEIEEVKVL